MKRNILRVGRSSLAISLPKEFVISNNLGAGQEINVVHHGSSMTVACDNTLSLSKTIDLRGLSIKHHLDRLFEKFLGALFRQGVDHFKVICDNNEDAEILRNILRNGKLNMYEDPEVESQNIVNVHSSIIRFDESAVEKMIEVVIKQIYAILDGYIEALEEGKIDDVKAERLMSRDKIINDQTDICKRIINKNVKDYRSTTLYNFVDRLEKIGDALKEMILYSIKNANAKKYSPLIKNTRTMIYILYMSYNKFTIKKVNEFYTNSEVWEPTKDPGGDILLYYYCQLLVRIIRNAYANLLVIKL